tara:strand:+ start:1815 stop:3536 length:1722 start_codon:yes stop_codon:yes gene_type:complete
MKRSREEYSRISYRPLFTKVFEYYQKQALGNISTLRPKQHMECLVDTGSVKKECKGDRRLAFIRKYLDAIEGYERSEMQKTFHERFLQSVALHIYRDDVDIDMDQIMKMNDWQNLKQQVLCLTPRRFGKTTAVSMFVGGYALAVEKSNQCIFSTGKRASDSLLAKVVELMKLTPYYDASRIKRKGEILYIQGDDPDDVRKICSYPSGSKALRGVGGDVIYLEEAAFMSVSMFHEVILPLLEMETTALICISTPQDSTNFYSVMFQMKDPSGETMFNTVEISMVCEDCKRAGTPEKCTHMKHLLPKWKSGGKQDMIKQIYGENTTDMMRESMGVTTSENNNVFDQKWIDALRDGVPKTLVNNPRWVFCACDPNGGGSSQMAIVTLAAEQNQYIILGLESHAVKGHGEIRTLLVEHVKFLCSKYPSSRVLFIPESNLGHEASHMASMLRSIEKVVSIRERGEPGVLTTHKRKELYANHAIELFAGGGIHFHEDLFSANPFLDANVRTDRMRKLFCKQMNQFQRLVIARGNAYDLPKIIYSGKQNGEDDFMMTFLIGLYWTTKFLAGKTTPNIRDF